MRGDSSRSNRGDVDMSPLTNSQPAVTGTAVLTAGAATVANTAITANSIIRLSSKTLGGTPGNLYVSAKTASTSFVITSSSGSDTGTVYYEILAY